MGNSNEQNVISNHQSFNISSNSVHSDEFIDFDELLAKLDSKYDEMVNQVNSNDVSIYEMIMI